MTVVLGPKKSTIIEKRMQNSVKTSIDRYCRSTTRKLSGRLLRYYYDDLSIGNDRVVSSIA